MEVAWACRSGWPEGEGCRIGWEEGLRIYDGNAAIPRPFAYPWHDAGEIRVEGAFSLAWRWLEAQFWGVAQRRKRIYLIADFAGMNAPKILIDLLNSQNRTEKTPEKEAMILA